MTLTQYTVCPHCREGRLDPYNVDTSSTQRTSGTCPKCGKRYTVEYGKGKLKASKN